MSIGGVVVVAGNLLVLREPHALRNLPRLPTKIKYYLVLEMVTLMKNMAPFVVVMFQDQRSTNSRPRPHYAGKI